MRLHPKKDNFVIPRIKLLIESSRAYGQGLLRGIARYSRLHGPWIFSRKREFYQKQRRIEDVDVIEQDISGIIAHFTAGGSLSAQPIQTLLPRRQ